MLQTSTSRLPVRFLLIATTLLASLRLAHIHLLWADEDYHLAASLQLLHGRVPYRDFWYDKPPLTALYYLPIDAQAGWPLRLLDTAYILSACALLYRIGLRLYGVREAWLAALLLAFYTAFYLPSAVIPFAADATLLIPHLAAIWFVSSRRSWLAGIACGVGFWANPKALFVFAACALFIGHRRAITHILRFAAAFSFTLLAGFVVLYAIGAWPGYVEQVWRWGLQYAAGSPEPNPIGNGFLRTVNWLGFHATLAIAALYALRLRVPHVRLILGWIAFSFAAVVLGGRLAPHYFLQLLPPVIVLAAPGLVAACRQWPRLASAIACLTLLVPLVRFAPHYAQLIVDNLASRTPQWADVAMDLDSQQVAGFLNHRKQPGDSLLVWGYRPDIYVWTRLVPNALFWDSQPLTGVAADRHLHATTAIYSGPARLNRLLLIRSHPAWLVDGLSRFNPKLSPQTYPELQAWLAQYQLAGTTRLSLIYRRTIKTTQP